DENLAVADLAGLGCADDRLDDLVDQRVLDGDLDAGLRHEVDHVLGAAIQLGVTALPPEALDLGDGHSGNADFRQGGTDVVEFEGLDDCADEFHSPWLLSRMPRTANARSVPGRK